MAKQGGLASACYVGGYDLSGDVNSIGQISSPRDVLDFTAINDSAYERQYGLRSGSIAITSFFRGAGDWDADDDGGDLDGLVGSAGLALLPLTDEIATVFIGQALQSPAASVNGKQLNYDPTRGTDGSLTLAITVQGNAYGLEWGEQLTAGLRTDTTATTGAAITDAAGTSYGGQAYFHLTAFTGTSVTIDIQSCTTSGGSYATTGLTSSALTAPGSQRVAVSNTTAIDRYLEVVTTGTFTNAVFAVNFVRNASAGIVF